MDWQAAAAEAGRISQAWTAEGGPGGAVLAFAMAKMHERLKG